jgi:hypothetical protein
MEFYFRIAIYSILALSTIIYGIHNEWLSFIVGLGGLLFLIWLYNPKDKL